MPTMTLAEVQAMQPDLLLPPAPEFEAEYRERVHQGREIAKSKRACFLAICRNAMPWLPLTMQNVRSAGEQFQDWKAYIYENDSTDGTKECLESLPRESAGRIVCSLSDNGRPHLNYTKAADRTIALAEYRNACVAWAAENCRDYDYAIVFDTDPWGGFSVDGILNTIGHLGDHEWARAAGMGAYSWCQWGPPVWPQPTICHYDGWACRWTWVGEHQPWPYNPIWFHFWHPPVGSPPVKMVSCFGQLGVYRMKNYLQGVYRGGDCEHVAHWRSCGGDCYLNPSQRVVSFWIPKDAETEFGDRDGLHRDVHQDVAGRDTDPGHL